MSEGTIRVGEADKGEGYIEIASDRKEPEFLQYTSHFVEKQGTHFFLNLEHVKPARRIFGFLTNLQNERTALDNSKVKELGEKLRDLPSSYYLHLKSVHRAIKGNSDCKVWLIDDTCQEVGGNHEELSEFIMELKDVLFDAKWLCSMERKIPNVKFIPMEGMEKLKEILPQKVNPRENKGWRPQLEIGTILWKPKEFLTREQHVGKMKDALEKLKPISSFLERIS